MIKLINDELIQIKAVCIMVEDNEGVKVVGRAEITIINHIGSIFDLRVLQCNKVGDEEMKICTFPGWRWRIDRLLEGVPDNKPVYFWGWGVDPTGCIFPILGDDSDCERVEFVSPTPK